MTAFEVLDRLSTAYYGKQYYFEEQDGMIYSRECGEYYDIEFAVEEFEDKLRLDFD